MSDAMRSPVRGASWPLWGAAARRCRCPEGLGDDSAARSARAGRRPAGGPVAGAGAAQTRQLAQPDARDRGITHLYRRQIVSPSLITPATTSPATWYAR